MFHTTYLTWMIICGCFTAFMFLLYFGLTIKECVQTLRKIKAYEQSHQ